MNGTAPIRTAPRALAALVAIAALAGLLAVGATGTATARKSAKAAAKPVYDGLYKRKVSARNKKWARRVAECESGRDPNALGAGGTYRGAFQFHRTTWKNAPRSPGGDPIRFSYRTQSFIAVRLKMRDGRGAWPNCG